MAYNNITKQTVKAYLDHQGKEIAEQMKEKIENKDNWNDFKNELAVLIAEYSENPTLDIKDKINAAISVNFATNISFGRESLETIFQELGIHELEAEIPTFEMLEEVEMDKATEAYRRQVFAELGFEYPTDVVERKNREWQEMQDEKYGIVRKSAKRVETTIEPREETGIEETVEILNGEIVDDLPVEVSENRKPVDESVMIDMNTHKATITVEDIMNPSQVPPELFYENREAISQAVEKVNQLIAEMNEKIENETDNSKKAGLNQKLVILTGIRSNFEYIQTIILNYCKEQAGLDINEKRARLVECAKCKVCSLENVNLTGVINNGAKQNEQVMGKASTILLPELEPDKANQPERVNDDLDKSEQPDVRE